MKRFSYHNALQSIVVLNIFYPSRENISEKQKANERVYSDEKKT